MSATTSQCHWSKGSLVRDGVEPEEAHYPLNGLSCKPTSLICLLGCQDRGRKPLFLHEGCAGHRYQWSCSSSSSLTTGHGDQLSTRQDLQTFPAQSKYGVSILNTSHTVCSWTWLVRSTETENVSVAHTWSCMSSAGGTLEA